MQSGAPRTPAGAPNFHARGWLSRLVAAKRPQKLGLAPGVRSEEPEIRQSAPVAPRNSRSEHGAGKAPVPVRMRLSSHFTSGGVVCVQFAISPAPNKPPNQMCQRCPNGGWRTRRGAWRRRRCRDAQHSNPRKVRGLGEGEWRILTPYSRRRRAPSHIMCR